MEQWGTLGRWGDTERDSLGFLGVALEKQVWGALWA